MFEGKGKLVSSSENFSHSRYFHRGNRNCSLLFVIPGRRCLLEQRPNSKHLKFELYDSHKICRKAIRPPPHPACPPPSPHPQGRGSGWGVLLENPYERGQPCPRVGLLKATLARTGCPRSVLEIGPAKKCKISFFYWHQKCIRVHIMKVLALG